MATTKKSVKKTTKKAPVATAGVKKRTSAVAARVAVKPAQRKTSVKYTNMFAAYRAFWRRGFCEWAGTSSRSEYWLSWLTNMLVYIGFAVLFVCAAFLDAALFGDASVFVFIVFGGLALYILATIIPDISMTTRRMHDAGLSAWFWLLILTNCIPLVGEYIASVVFLIITLLPTQNGDNPYHKNNK